MSRDESKRKNLYRLSRHAVERSRALNTALIVSYFMPPRRFVPKRVRVIFAK